MTKLQIYYNQFLLLHSYKSVKNYYFHNKKYHIMDTRGVGIIIYDYLVPILIMWGIPGLLVIRSYLKLSAEEKRSVIKEIKHPQQIFTVGFTLLGVFFTHLSVIGLNDFVRILGNVFLLIGGLVTMVVIWRISKIRSLFVFILMLMFVLFFW